RLPLSARESLAATDRHKAHPFAWSRVLRIVGDYSLDHCGVHLEERGTIAVHGTTVFDICNIFLSGLDCRRNRYPLEVAACSRIRTPADSTPHVRYNNRH